MKNYILSFLLLCAVAAMCDVSTTPPPRVKPVYGYQFLKDTLSAKDIILRNDTTNANAVRPIGATVTGLLYRSPCGCILHVRDSISSAQILNSNTSPVTIIPAPGPGYYIDIVNEYGNYVYSGASYTDTLSSGLIEGDTSNLMTSTKTVTTSSSDKWFKTTTIGNLLSGSFVNQPVQYFTQLANPRNGGGYLIENIDYILVKY